jgi:hypothetical protein
MQAALNVLKMMSHRPERIFDSPLEARKDIKIFSPCQRRLHGRRAIIPLVQLAYNPSNMAFLTGEEALWPFGVDRRVAKSVAVPLPLPSDPVYCNQGGMQVRGYT